MIAIAKQDAQAVVTLLTASANDLAIAIQRVDLPAIARRPIEQEIARIRSIANALKSQLEAPPPVAKPSLPESVPAKPAVGRPKPRSSYRDPYPAAEEDEI